MIRTQQRFSYRSVAGTLLRSKGVRFDDLLREAQGGHVQQCRLGGVEKQSRSIQPDSARRSHCPALAHLLATSKCRTGEC